MKLFPTLLKRGGLAGLLLCAGSAAVAQPTTYCTTSLGGYCGVGNYNISQVTITGTTLNNPSSCATSNGNAYSLFPASSGSTATLLRGTTYSLGVMSPEDATLAVWVDWNQDGTFSAAEWTLVTAASTPNVLSNVSLAVSATATLGPTRLRVRARASAVPDALPATGACASYGSGEIEDYIITIGAGVATATQAEATPESLLVYPNPSAIGQLTLRLPTPGVASQVSLLNALGQVVLSQAVPAAAEHTLCTQYLVPGVYLLRVAQGAQVASRRVVLY